jgi:hypothetical protein
MRSHILKVLVMAMMVGSLSAGTASKSEDCVIDYMSDSCATLDYAIVESERFVKSPHNWMESAHSDPCLGNPVCYKRRKYGRRNHRNGRRYRVSARRR